MKRLWLMFVIISELFKRKTTPVMCTLTLGAFWLHACQNTLLPHKEMVPARCPFKTCKKKKNILNHKRKSNFLYNRSFNTIFFFLILVNLCLCIVCVWICMLQDVSEAINLAHNRLYAGGLFHWLEGSDITS